jgi:hypothetical protein
MVMRTSNPKLRITSFVGPGQVPGSCEDRHSTEVIQWVIVSVVTHVGLD